MNLCSLIAGVGQAHFASGLRRALSLALLFTAFTVGTASLSAADAAPYVTQRTSLTIPFSVNAGQADFKPVEVQVFASYDRGKTWHLYSRHRPEEGEFLFRTKRDGEYWFATRTLDAQRRAFPEGELGPQLKVVVDTAQPVLDLTAEVENTGEIALNWQLRDEWLEPKTFKLTYQAAAVQGSSEWLDIPFEYAGRQQGDAFVGHTAWLPQTSQRVLNIRAQVQDQAGNTTVVSRQIFLPKTTAKSTPLAVAPAPGGAQPLPAAPSEMLPPKPAGQENRTPLATAQPRNSWNSLAGDSAQPQVAQTDNGNAANPTGDVRWPVDAENSNSSNQPSVDAFANQSQQGPGRLASSEGLAGQANQELGYPLDSAALPFNTSPVPPTAAMPSSTAPPAATASPAPTSPAPNRNAENWLANERPRLTKSNRFSLDYEVDSVSPDNLSDVELWGTSDGGRSWLKWGSDNDRTSPFEVEVSSEAIYGFRIVIVARNGVASPPPQAGDSADIWIQVDSTPPTVRLTQAAYGQKEQAGQLDIRWEAADAALADRPITLSFSDRPAGPFTTIAAGLPNNGQFWWPFDPRSPRQIYLRIEARDAAGNVGVYNLPEPINAEGLIPRGRIRAINTPDESARDAFLPQQFR